ncbi:hypothetical protein [Kitasatospora cheerisanensis]|uniref:Hydrolase n=1 Tax=Kitasatospora cheerisanensis KCTC 2395 TaxID=1348663 RepID=A0A066Z1R3_9ACTN|nr:hypothetical protein [Kitasatospora cheerisanensis]KDN87683.1 hydrolase [Kitasatospora cheerisanensis KCTC 2395]
MTRTAPPAGPHRITAASRRVGLRPHLRLGLAFAGLLATAAPASATAAPDAAPVPRLAWTACADGFQCTTARVPLDHHDPHGATIDLAVLRHPAEDPAHRIGSLFYNPGGPAVPAPPRCP